MAAAFPHPPSRQQQYNVTNSDHYIGTQQGSIDITISQAKGLRTGSKYKNEDDEDSIPYLHFKPPYPIYFCVVFC